MTSSDSVPTTSGNIEQPQLRLAVIGCGRIAQTHVDAVADTAETCLEAVVDLRQATAEAAAEKQRCRAFEDYRDPELLEAVDAVIVCTPPNTHFDVARFYLERGVHVLCEKPLTIRSEEAQRLVGIAAEHGRLLMMCSKFRYVDDVIKAKAILEAGILGDLILYENSFCGKVAMRDRWNSDPKVAGGGVLIDNGSHSVDIARYLVGPIREVQAQKGRPAQDLEVEDTVRFQFRTETGVMGAVDLSWSLDKESDAYIRVFGDQGTLEVGWQGSRYRQDGSPKWVPFGQGYGKMAAFQRQLENFVGTIRGREVPLIRPEDALASVEVIEAAYESADHDHWFPVGKR